MHFVNIYADKSGGIQLLLNVRLATLFRHTRPITPADT